MLKAAALWQAGPRCRGLPQGKGMSADVVSDLLHHESSLLGVSGPSDDMHTLLSIEYGHFQQSTPIKFSRCTKGIIFFTIIKSHSGVMWFANRSTEGEGGLLSNECWLS